MSSNWVPEEASNSSKSILGKRPIHSEARKANFALCLSGQKLVRTCWRRLFSIGCQSDYIIIDLSNSIHHPETWLCIEQYVQPDDQSYFVCACHKSNHIRKVVLIQSCRDNGKFVALRSPPVGRKRLGLKVSFYHDMVHDNFTKQFVTRTAPSSLWN